MNERVFEGPHSTIFTEVSLACYFRLSFNFAVDFASFSIKTLSNFDLRTSSEKARVNAAASAVTSQLNYLKCISLLYPVCQNIVL